MGGASGTFTAAATAERLPLKKSESGPSAGAGGGG
jgi:hypothetical protein